MSSVLRDLSTLRDPANIEKAGLASSPYVLRKIFSADPTIQRLIRVGKKVVPVIDELIDKQAEPLDEVTLAAFAFIVENVEAEAAPRVLGPRFRNSVMAPGPFFVHFAAHAIRSGLRLPIKPLQMAYTPAELIETQNMLR